MTRRIRRGDDEGSLVMAILVAFIGIAVVAMLTPIVLTQHSSTTTEDQHAGAISAAQAGLDVAFGKINAAASVVSGVRVGDPTKLPCGPLTGTDSAAGGPNTGVYTTRVDYFATDPTGLYYNGVTHTWDDTTIGSTHIPCTAGAGTGTTVPLYALVRSQGAQSASAPVRSLVATYKFRLGNANIPGGLIHVFTVPGSQDLCLDAGSAAPPAGTNVRMQPCTEGLAQQNFAYTQTLTLLLTSSKTASNPNGLCLDAGAVPHTLGAYVTLQNCAAVTQPRQQWSYNGRANFSGTADGQTVDDYCFNVQNPNAAGSYVVLGSGATSTCGQPYDNIESFSPEASVGAGMASASTGQLVNYQEFGRCLDVTRGKVNYGYLIAFTCKQAPDPSKLSWNELWDLPDPIGSATSATGHITTTYSNTAYCLTSPLSTASGQYPQVTPCSGATASTIAWTVYGDTGVFATSYVIKDSAGYCLQPSLTDFQDTGADDIGKIIMAPCDGTALQKWNAPADAATLLASIGER